ncbi:MULTISPECIES: Spy/CpxP family protein refolding chaperone [Pseudomonas]|uniref:LTXXQ domain protein n=1 Tax=Pseudomonas donghuensis TaxID=1163398 RepID=A0AAP0SN53_9PSED|nr:MULTISPECIES: Spy/CpxP family protein refolding chaperone [Pseudomonas]MDF9892350.1 Spy/CpxP family protein refolding chaperone [Pseudomonas vranovensis]KDO01813.1 LTXXQ domain protein [Pseudomonas donghuensis]MBS7600009.1 LTXXQ domain protein [Pseudomonas sp. RC2C2]MCP6694403.1 Spy/CpxP family protein refolding chaperone [Pseudomonas donghuensis]PJY94282.1 LTXXQ domain protein [Pseudomonas donghuensis]
MRKTLIALMLAAALPTVAMAMPDAGGPPHGEHHSEHQGEYHRGGGEHHRGGAPFAQLDLSREQRQQIGKLMGEQMKSRHEITQRYLEKLPAADQQALKDELKAKRDKTQAEIRALLKPEQQKQFDEMKKKQDERRAEWAEFKAWKAEKAKKAQ